MTTNWTDRGPWDPLEQDCCLGWPECPLKFDCPGAPEHLRTYPRGGALFTQRELDALEVLKAGYLKYWGGPQDGEDVYGK